MIPRRAQLLGFAVLVAGTITMMVVLKRHGAPLAVGDVSGIRALELAPTASAAKNVTDAWSDALKTLAYEDIRFDYAFIALYSTTLAFAGFIGAVVFAGRWARLGLVLGWLMWFAGLCDVAENLGMTAELGGTLSVAPLVCLVSSVKWILTIVGFVYGIAVLVGIAVRCRSPVISG